MALLAAVAATAATANDSDPRTSVPLLLKIMGYDLNFEAKVSRECVILVASEPDQAAARGKLLEALKELSKPVVKNRPVRFLAAEFRDEGTLDNEIQKANAKAILVVPGVSAAGVKAVSEVSQDNQIYTLALDPGMVQGALAIGVESAGGRAQIVINDKASKALGIRFEPSVLKLAKVIQ